MPLATAQTSAPQQDDPQMAMNSWRAFLNAAPASTAGATGNSLTSSASAMYPQTAAAAPAANDPAAAATGTTNATGTGAAAQTLDPAVTSFFNQKIAENPTDPTLGQAQYVDPKTGTQYFGRFEQTGYGGEGSSPTMKLTGYSAGNYDTKTGGDFHVYDANGNYTGQSEHWDADKTAWMDDAAFMAAGMFGAQFASALAGLGGTAATQGGSNFATGFTDTGTAGGTAADSYAGSGAVTGANGGITSAGGNSLLTGPTSVNADYTLLTGNADPSGVVLDGNSGGGLNVASRSGEGLQFNQSPNMSAMGGGQGVTTTGSQVLGDSGSFVNDPALNVADAGKQVISEPGVYTPENPYTPDLGDPASPINSGSNPWPAAPASPSGPLDWLKDIINPGSTGGGVIAPSIIPPIVQALFPPDQQPLVPPATPSPTTPPQPMVGAGSFADNNAQGGAAGSMAGVAGTLLTAKDTFGYGKSMLT